MLGCVVILLLVIVLIFIFIYNKRNFPSRPSFSCDYFNKRNKGGKIISLLRNVDIHEDITKEKLTSYLTNQGYSKDDISYFYQFICNLNLSVPNICGLQQQEIFILNYIKGVVCPLWKCKTCCGKGEQNFGSQNFLLETHDPQHCAIEASRRGYAGFAPMQVGNNAIKCYGLDNVSFSSCAPSISPGCPSVSCNMGGCFGKNPNNENGCGGGYNRVGSKTNSNYPIYCIGGTQEELDACLNS